MLESRNRALIFNWTATGMRESERVPYGPEQYIRYSDHQRLIAAASESVPSETERKENPPRLWRVRFDAWYEAHRDPGQTSKQPERERGYVIVQADDSERAIKAALKWAEDGLFKSKGRKFLSVEHRETAALKLPMNLDVLGERRSEVK